MVQPQVFHMASLAMMALLASASPLLTAREAAACVETTIHSLNPNDTTTFACGSAFTMIPSRPSSTAESQTTGNATLQKRCTDPVDYSFQETKIVASGTWWDVWVRDSKCSECGQSSGSCSAAMNWADTTTSSFTAGFDLSTQDKVLDLIKGNAGFNLGYTWGKSFTKGSTFTCNINAHDKAAIWIQNEMGWADSQTRVVTSTRGCGANNIQYDAWSPNQRSNWALDGDIHVNVGCSSGAAAGC